VQTCLAKDPEDRWQSAGDLKRQIEAIAEAGSPASSPAAIPAVAPRRLPRGFAWAVLAVAGILLVALISRLGDRQAPTAPRLQVEIASPIGARFVLDGPNIASITLSPDGEHLTFLAPTEDGERLWVRTLATCEARPLQGTEDATYPFWSPDGKFIAFMARGRLLKVPAAGGAVIDLCHAEEGRGGSWSQDGTILFAPHRASGSMGSAEESRYGHGVRQGPERDDAPLAAFPAGRQVSCSSPQTTPQRRRAASTPSISRRSRRLENGACPACQIERAAPPDTFYVQGGRWCTAFVPTVELVGEPARWSRDPLETGFFRGVFAAAGDRLVFQRGGTASVYELPW
jgi:hypothetical protein